MKLFKEINDSPSGRFQRGFLHTLVEGEDSNAPSPISEVNSPYLVPLSPPSLLSLSVCA